MKCSFPVRFLAFFLVGFVSIQASDIPQLSCTLQPPVRTSKGRILYFLNISNVSSQEISLAATRVPQITKTPLLYFDTEPIAVRSGPDLMVPAFYTDTLNSENQTLRLGSDYVRSAIQKTTWNPSDIVVLAPGAEIKCLLNGTPPDFLITLHFLQLVDQTFRSLDTPLANSRPN